MKRATLALVLGCLALSGWATTAEAGQPNPTTRRFTRGSYAEYVKGTRKGKPVMRQVYSGYANKFPSPLIYYEGFPHSGSYGQMAPMPGQGL